MSVESNKNVIRRFFKEVLDGGKADFIDALFTPGCVIHRPGSQEPQGSWKDNIIY